MTVYLRHATEGIEVAIRAEGDGAIGDIFDVIRPGQPFLGRPFDYWQALPDGPHEITPDATLDQPAQP
jgi:hypothetical protein